jgi:hypothetical protein
MDKIKIRENANLKRLSTLLWGIQFLKLGMKSVALFRTPKTIFGLLPMVKEFLNRINFLKFIIRLPN